MPESGATFERFTPRAQRAIISAHQHAGRAGHPEVLPVHLAQGLLHEPDGLAARAIETLGGSLEDAEVRLTAAAAAAAGTDSAAATAGPGADEATFGPQARKVLTLALREALLLQHNYIGTEHILLGLLDDGHVDLGFTRESAVDWLTGALASNA